MTRFEIVCTVYPAPFLSHCYCPLQPCEELQTLAAENLQHLIDLVEKRTPCPTYKIVKNLVTGLLEDQMVYPTIDTTVNPLVFVNYGSAGSECSTPTTPATPATPTTPLTPDIMSKVRYNCHYNVCASAKLLSHHLTTFFVRTAQRFSYPPHSAGLLSHIYITYKISQISTLNKFDGMITYVSYTGSISKSGRGRCKKEAGGS